MFTGFMMTSCISVKFVGLFTVILVGLKTIEDMWDILGDLKKPFVCFYYKKYSFTVQVICIIVDNIFQKYTIQHFCARFLVLIVFPILLYMTYFYVHLQILNRRYLIIYTLLRINYLHFFFYFLIKYFGFAVEMEMVFIVLVFSLS